MSIILPPKDFGTRDPLIRLIPKGTTLHRFHNAAHDPFYFEDQKQGRLSSPDQSYGVLYAALKRDGAFAETFLRNVGGTLLTPDMIAHKAYAQFEVVRNLRFVELTGKGLARIGATAEVTHAGGPYDVPQAWSAAVYAHSGTFDGIAYMARHDDQELCFAIFNRSERHITVARKIMEFHNEDWFEELLENYQVGLGL